MVGATLADAVWGPCGPWRFTLKDTGGEVGDVGPTPPCGRDKSGPYALAIASLGIPGQFANSILVGFYRGQVSPSNQWASYLNTRLLSSSVK